MDMTRLSCLVLSYPCPRCEQNWRQVKTVGDRKLRNCIVQSRNVVRTTENSLDLSPILFTPPTRQDKTVLSCPCRCCELSIIGNYIWAFDTCTKVNDLVWPRTVKTHMQSPVIEMSERNVRLMLNSCALFSRIILTISGTWRQWW